jgi:modulator of FtsH protease
MEAVTTPSDWEAFYAAQVGAAAALAGLLFVGISLNLQKILGAAFLPLRAILALILLVAILAVSSFLLMPGLGEAVAGAGILGIGALIVLAGTMIEAIGWRERTPQQHRGTFLFNALLLEAATIPWLIGGILVLSGASSGYYWLAGGVVLAFVKAVVDAWVLLVEINR